MLWLKAWLETRWKAAFMLLFGALFYGVFVWLARGAPASYRMNWLMGIPEWSVFVSVFVTVTLAGTGIETESTRPGELTKGGEGSKLYTLALPVTRARLFWVRTVTGVLETGAILLLLGVAEWLLLSPPLAGNLGDALETFGLILFVSVTVYAIQACLSTFCDEGWRIRISGLALGVGFYLHIVHRLPWAIDLFQLIGLESPLVTHQIPWVMLIASGLLAIVLFAAALTIIQKRDY